MYIRQPKTPEFSPQQGFDPSSYQIHLYAKLTELQNFVKENLTAAAVKQKHMTATP